MARKTKSEVIPNQVFVGCPWKTVRPKYEKAIESLNKKYPLSFVIIGRDASQEAEDLLETIKTKLISSSYAIFDATGGNPNVSLEFGFAEANSIPRALYTSTHKASRRGDDQPAIIADLAGKKRNIYKTQKSLSQLLAALARNHNYTKQFEKALRESSASFSKGKKKRYRALSLKVIHALDGGQKMRRADLVQNLLALVQGYDESEIDEVVRILHSQGLLISEAGRYSRLRML
jgi:hypothetical protein